MDDIIAARVHGEPWAQLPQDLYIPPDALRIFLDAFEGPLDLLLYLIKKQNFNILDIPIAEITRQYIQYVNLMHELQLELAAEYLVMAAILAEIKSRLLLPKPPLSEEQEGEDPRSELVRQLQEYERYRSAARSLAALPHLERDFFLTELTVSGRESYSPEPPEVQLEDLLFVLQRVIQRSQLYTHHAITRETLSIRERMTEVLLQLQNVKCIAFTHFLRMKEGSLGVAVTLIALLELARQSCVKLDQSAEFAPIFIQAKE